MVDRARSLCQFRLEAVKKSPIGIRRLICPASLRSILDLSYDSRKREPATPFERFEAKQIISPSLGPLFLTASYREKAL